eukprot:gb/GECG01011394.1/.p1 GENE.gb/GECG01011394.1/~~gb/GECG01011394.1/.p1  ORF type:complete len:141 (+),score=19.42 gb/GECG01011394.1/:1-423(+)
MDSTANQELEHQQALVRRINGSVKHLTENLTEINALLQPVKDLASASSGRKCSHQCENDTQERIRQNAQSMNAVGEILFEYRERYFNELRKRQARDTSQQEAAPKTARISSNRKPTAKGERASYNRRQATTTPGSARTRS